ncbi:MAG: tetratricopeptide repeat protein [Ignavibacterium sp.]|nr:tetratricopeptide repeat protein [Ignavibacterium sp.]
MRNANEYYKNNRYQLAVDEYNKLIDDGYTGVSLFYNLGNSYYRLGQVGYAILYYEKALTISPNDEDVLHNLELVKQHLKDKVDTLPPFFIFNLWEGLLAFFSVTGWTFLVYIFFILFLITIVLYFFSKSISQQRAAVFSAIGIFIVLFLTILLLAVKMNKEFNIKYGIVVNKSVLVKSAPDQTSNDEFQVHEGLKVKVEDNVDDWLKIRLEDGKIGWVSKQSVGII